MTNKTMVMKDVSKCIQTCRKAFDTGMTKKLSFRRRQLEGLRRMLSENEALICSAVKSDLGRDESDTWMMEVLMVNNEIVDALDHMESWAKDEYQPKELLQITSSIYIRKEPYGVCLIMSAFNYPFSLLINPLVAAIAAGNCAVLKTSEASIASAKLLVELLPKYIDKECYPVLNLDGAQSAQMLKENRFDLIFFTGGTYVGKLIMKAAAENLTPVVLELGGKNPCFVNHDCDVDIAAKRIAFAKYSNAGLTCLAPDYVLCHDKIKDQFVSSVKKWIEHFYGKDPKQSKYYTRIINRREVQRIHDNLDSCRDKIVYGGDVDFDDKYVAPTVVCDPDMDSPLMKQEMFGPVLIVLAVESMDDGIKIALKQEKPLALYAFSKNSKTLKGIMDSVQSGGVTLNDCMMHYVPSSLPFGGVGNSGLGAYHGKHGFDAFTHKRGVYDDGTPESWRDMRYPPVTEANIKMLKRIVLKTPKTSGSGRKWLLVLFIAIATSAYMKFGFKGF